MGESSMFLPDDTSIRPPPVMPTKANDVYKREKIFEEFFILSGIPDGSGR
jgi:hypothetical protein